jgi:hypothetical protein
MSEVPRRRWFQFGIGTMLLVVTAFAAFLGWELSYIRERHAMHKRVVDRGGVIVLGIDQREIARGTVQIPFWRRWLGDCAVGMLMLESDATPADVERAKAAFPEVLYCKAVRSPGSVSRRPPQR